MVLDKWGTKKQLAGSILICIFGAIIMSFGIGVFLAPIKIPVGGFTGIATVLSTAGIVNLSIGMIALIMNIPLFIFSYRQLGSRFGVLSVISTLSYTIALDLIVRIPQLMEFASQINDQMLSMIYGACLYGIGLGIIIRTGGSTGGSDMLANVISRKINNNNLGIIIFCIDFSVILLAGVVFRSFIAPLYAFLTTFLSSKVIDYLIEGGKRSKAYYIFSDHTEEIAASIVKELGRGATAFKGRGMFTNKERDMLLCLVLRTQTAQLKKIVKTIDSHAFLFATNTNEAFGEGFTPFDVKK